MKHWKAVRIEDCCRIVSGATPSTSVQEYWGGDIRWATPKDLSDLDGHYLEDTSRKITRAGLQSCAAEVLPAGSVLFSSRAPIGLVAVNSVEMATNQGFKSFVPEPSKADAKYLFHWLRFNRSILEQLGNGATFKEVSKAVVARIEIPLPAVSEQRRIAAILDQADALRAQRRAAMGKLQGLHLSIFLDIFGDPATNPKIWPQRRLVELSNKFSDGPFGSNLKTSHYSPTGVRVVRLQNIGVGMFLDDDKAFISEDHFQELSKHECLPGDVLVGTLGDPNLRACILPEHIGQALNKADCVQIRPRLDRATAEYTCALLNTPSMEVKAQSMTLGQTRLRISMGRLRDLIVPCPPMGVQTEFQRKIKAIEGFRVNEEASRAKLDALFASLQHHAFQGEL